jgi:hypothetical protein
MPYPHRASECQAHLCRSQQGVPNLRGTTTSGVEADQLSYFAASVFWRAGVHNWPVADRIELGPYEEQLRLFLLDEADFPQDGVLIVTVSSTNDQFSNESMAFPFIKDHTAHFRQYRFWIPGLTFQIFFGRAIPREIRMLCSVRSPRRNIYVGVELERSKMADMGHMVKTSRVIGDLR